MSVTQKQGVMYTNRGQTQKVLKELASHNFVEYSI